jgi:hypothetical protein
VNPLIPSTGDSKTLPAPPGRLWRGRRLVRCALALLVCVGVGHRADAGEAASIGLAEALRALQRDGLPVVFSSALVTDSMEVEAPGVGEEPRRALDRMLAAHGLAVESGRAGTLVVVRTTGALMLEGQVSSRHGGAPVAGAIVRVVELDAEVTTARDGSFRLSLAAGEYSLEARRPGFVIEQTRARVPGAPVAIQLQPAPLAGAEIAVHPSRLSLLRDQPHEPLSLGREAILDLPQLGGDLFRALDLLPGVASNDFSANRSCVVADATRCWCCSTVRSCTRPTT